MSNELKWKWAYGPYLDPPEGQKESAIKAGYIKVVSKQSADEVIAELKQKLEDVQASHYAEMVDAGMRERRLRRALYKACANWALSTLAWLDCIDQGEPRKWSEMIQKCRAKAEQYK